MKKTTLFLTLFLAALAATAQQATISGSILKPDGTVAPGVIVKLPEGDVTGFDFYAIKVGDLSW